MNSFLLYVVFSFFLISLPLLTYFLSRRDPACERMRARARETGPVAACNDDVAGRSRATAPSVSVAKRSYRLPRDHRGNGVHATTPTRSGSPERQDVSENSGSSVFFTRWEKQASEQKTPR
jgi:hypothetical protein